MYKFVEKQNLFYACERKSSKSDFPVLTCFSTSKLTIALNIQLHLHISLSYDIVHWYLTCDSYFCGFSAIKKPFKCNQSQWTVSLNYCILVYVLEETFGTRKICDVIQCRVAADNVEDEFNLFFKYCQSAVVFIKFSFMVTDNSSRWTRKLVYFTFINIITGTRLYLQKWSTHRRLALKVIWLITINIFETRKQISDRFTAWTHTTERWRARESLKWIVKRIPKKKFS